MNCPDSERLAAYAEGRLEGAEADSLLAHCADCDDCRRELALVTLGRGEAGPSAPVPAALRARTVKAVVRSLERDRDRTPRHASARIAVLRERKSVFPIGLAAAAALFVALAGLIALVQTRSSRPLSPAPSPAPEARRSAPAVPAPLPSPPPRGERLVPEPRLPEPPRELAVRPVPVPPPAPPPAVERRPAPEPEPEREIVTPTPEPPPKPEETRAEELPQKPAHTVAARSFSELQITDVTGSLSVRRKGGAREKLAGVARLSESDVLTAEKPSSFQVEGRHPVVLAENAQVSLAYASLEQAPWLHIRGGEAMVDSTGPTRWIVSDGRVALVIKQARARFATVPGEDRLIVTPLTEPLLVQPDGGRVQAVRPGQELQVGKAAAEVRPLDPAVVARKSAAFEAGRPKTRTVFYTSCDPADGNRGHCFVQEGTFFKNEALLARERPDRTSAVVVNPNPRFAWGKSLLVRFRYRTNATNLQLSLPCSERSYWLFKDIAVGRSNSHQWVQVEFPIVNLGWKREDGVTSLTFTTQDKFDEIRFSARQQDVFGDQKLYLLIDDIQFVDRE